MSVLPGEREHWDAVQRAETAPLRALALADYWAGWRRAGLRLLDVVASAGGSSSSEFGPYYVMSCTDTEFLLSRITWASPAFSSRVTVVIEATHRYRRDVPPTLELIEDAPEGIVIGLSPHPDAEPPKQLKLVFCGGNARPGFSRNIEQARWMYEMLRQH